MRSMELLIARLLATNLPNHQSPHVLCQALLIIAISHRTLTLVGGRSTTLPRTIRTAGLRWTLIVIMDADHRVLLSSVMTIAGETPPDRIVHPRMIGVAPIPPMAELSQTEGTMGAEEEEATILKTGLNLSLQMNGLKGNQFSAHEIKSCSLAKSSTFMYSSILFL